MKTVNLFSRLIHLCRIEHSVEHNCYIYVLVYPFFLTTQFLVISIFMMYVARKSGSPKESNNGIYFPASLVKKKTERWDEFSPLPETVINFVFLSSWIKMLIPGAF